MDNIKIKLKQVYFPFLVVSIVSILFYNTFRWVFAIKLGVLPIKENFLDIWIPLVFSWVPIYIWLRKRARILDMNGRTSSYYNFLFMMAIVISIPIIISQTYIEKVSFDLVPLNNIDEVNNYHNEKYFTISSFGVVNRATTSYTTAKTSGKKNNTLNYYLYLANPFENTDNVWYGVTYKKTLSNKLNKDKKDAAYKSFINKSLKEFDTYDFQNVMYFEKMGYSDERDGYFEAFKEINNINIEKQIVLIPKTSNFDGRLGNTFAWIFGSFGIGALIIFILIVILKIDKKELNDFLGTHNTQHI